MNFSKSLAVAATLALALCPWGANSQEPSTDNEQHNLSSSEVCKLVETLATSIMGGRQGGVPMSQALELFSDVGAGTQFGAAIESLIIEAYEVPRYSTDEMITRTEEEFASQAFLDCYKSYKQ